MNFNFNAKSINLKEKKENLVKKIKNLDIKDKAHKAKNVVIKKKTKVVLGVKNFSPKASFVQCKSKVVNKIRHWSFARFKAELKEKKSAIVVVMTVISLVVSTTVVSATMTASAATADYWDVKVGNKVMAVVKTAEEANNIVNGVKNYYVSEGAEVIAVKVTPTLMATPHAYKKSEKQPKLSNVQEAIDKIIAGKVVKEKYTVQDGDTIWDIAVAKELSIANLSELNEGLDIDNIHPGDVINYNVVTPYVEVTTEQKVQYDQAIPYETVTEENSSMYKGEKNVKTAGENGSRHVTAQVVTKNGTTESSVELESVVTKEATNEVIEEGTKEKPGAVSAAGGSSSSRRAVSYGGGVTYNGSGSSIAAYATQFVGNPYVYGGTSLTNGADCSGFVYRVYNNCGIGIPRTGQGSVGRSVSYSEAKPGDVIIYPGHVSIYIGGGREVHAINESRGIDTTSVGYTGSVLDIRRIVE